MAATWASLRLIPPRAVWTIIARNPFTAVVGFVSFGLLVTLASVRLDAIDAALTEAAIGSGLTGALLLGAAARLSTDQTATQTQHPGRARWLAAALRTWVTGSPDITLLSTAAIEAALRPSSRAWSWSMRTRTCRRGSIQSKLIRRARASPATTSAKRKATSRTSVSPGR